MTKTTYHNISLIMMKNLNLGERERVIMTQRYVGLDRRIEIGQEIFVNMPAVLSCQSMHQLNTVLVLANYKNQEQNRKENKGPSKILKGNQWSHQKVGDLCKTKCVPTYLLIDRQATFCPFHLFFFHSSRVPHLLSLIYIASGSTLPVVLDRRNPFVRSSWFGVQTNEQLVMLRTFIIIVSFKYRLI